MGDVREGVLVIGSRYSLLSIIPFTVPCGQFSFSVFLFDAPLSRQANECLKGVMTTTYQGPNTEFLQRLRNDSYFPRDLNLHTTNASLKEKGRYLTHTHFSLIIKGRRKEKEKVCGITQG